GGGTPLAGFAVGGGGRGFDGVVLPAGLGAGPGGATDFSSLDAVCAASAAFSALLSGSAMLLAALHRLAERLPGDHYSCLGFLCMGFRRTRETWPGGMRPITHDRADGGIIACATFGDACRVMVHHTASSRGRLRP